MLFRRQTTRAQRPVTHGTLRATHFLSTALLLCTPVLPSQQSGPGGNAVVTVQPGAPGQPTRVLPPDAQTPAQIPTDADIVFMRGMIMHHNQAVEMTALMPSHTKTPELLALGKRIGISQTDEMGFMKRWLEDRGLSITDPAMHPMDMRGMDMGGMDMSSMSMPAMPGMLSPQQMDALRHASGLSFDHLFLTGMIQHHTGALTMVKQLFDTPAAGQDPVLFDFTNDVDNTQQAEIDIMRHMLAKEKQ